MRTRILLIGLCLLLVGTAFAPTAAARSLGGDDSDECTKPSSTGVHKACGKVWVVNHTVECVWNGSWHEVNAGAVVYREYRCSGPDPA